MSNSRPWIEPDDVKSYSAFSKVKARTDQQLQMDIRRAERIIIKYVGHDFSDTTKYPTIPQDVKDADILISEYIADNASSSSVGFKSESFDDYSYTKFDSDAIGLLDVGPLLDPYIKEAESSGNIRFRMGLM